MVLMLLFKDQLLLILVKIKHFSLKVQDLTLKFFFLLKKGCFLKLFKQILLLLNVLVYFSALVKLLLVG